jgi:leader peptidase (prepilin peptidase)/N-methyltransferase
MSHAAALLGSLLFYWLLVALAALDAEEFWLPDWITLPGVALGIVNKLAIQFLLFHSSGHEAVHTYFDIAMGAGIDVILAGGLVLVIRWIYWLVKRREGIGLGDAKLMAMLGAWLGIEGALLAFGIGVVLGAVVALTMLARHQKNHEQVVLAATKLPLGTFLCIGGIVSGLWGDQIVMMYLRWAGF